MRLLFVVNDASYFVSHRLEIALAAREAGYEVHVATPPALAIGNIISHGLTHHVFSMNRSGKNPFVEMFTLLMLIRLFSRLKPDIVHLVTIKPVIYGGIVFTQKGFRASVIRYIVSRLYRIALGMPGVCAIFQNSRDAEYISRITALTSKQKVLVRGSGVDLQAYAPKLLPDGIPAVILAARLLIAKGGAEFAEADRLLRQRGVKARFALIGAPDAGNPTSLSQNAKARQ